MRVTSSNIDSVDYDESAKLLKVTFKSGALYYYEGVPAATFQNMLRASSAGQFLHNVVIPRHKATRISGSQ